MLGDLNRLALNSRHLTRPYALFVQGALIRY